MKKEWIDNFEQSIKDGIDLKNQIIVQLKDTVLQAAQQLITTVQNNGKILTCGNGGSAADAQHMAAELVVRLKSSNNRPAIPAIALNVNDSILTAAANDFGFDFIFSRQIEAIGHLKDTLIAISTSGNSSNVIEAVNMAHEKGLYVIGLMGGNGGKLRKLVDLSIIIQSQNTARIQEAHILIIHILCDILEQELFPQQT